MAKRLTEKHPLSQKVVKLEKFMSELGISFEWDGYHMVVTDCETNVSACYRDAESGDEIQNIPYGFEVKLVVTNENL